MRDFRILAVVLAGCLTLSAPAGFASGLQDDVNQAVTILTRFESIPEKSIPPAVLRDAKGLAILTVLKGGFIVSGQGGKGLVMARTKDGWSGPSAIGTGGIGVGFQIGGEVSELVIVLNTAEAVKAFSRGGNVSLGADVSVAAGPVGRTAGASITPMAAVYTYSRSQGAFAGISLEGMVIAERSEANRDYYGRDVAPADVLSGKVQPPPGPRPLREVLAKY